MAFHTPLRYPGGKGKLTNFVKVIFEQNDLLDGHYVEPYAGGAGIAMALLLHEYASCVHLNDLNKSVYAFWYSVLHHTDDLTRRIRNVRVTMAEWHRQKRVQMNPGEHSLLDLGFSTFFLNRTNRSGIILAGVIGGKNQDGAWKLNARFTKKDLISRIESIALFGTRIRLYNQDAADLIRRVLPNLPDKTLVYLDPPYYVKGQDLYENYYGHEDHKAIAKLVQREIRQPWIVSYDNADEIRSMYTKCLQMEYGINYSAHGRYRGREVMFFGKKVAVPAVDDPVRVRYA